MSKNKIQFIRRGPQDYGEYGAIIYFSKYKNEVKISYHNRQFMCHTCLSIYVYNRDINGNYYFSSSNRNHKDEYSVFDTEEKKKLALNKFKQAINE